MRIAIINTCSPDSVSLPAYVSHVVEHLSSKNEVSEIIHITKSSLYKNTYATQQGVSKITVEPYWKLNYIYSILNIRNIISKTAPDAVLLNYSWSISQGQKFSLYIGLLVLFYCKLIGLPSVSLVCNCEESSKSVQNIYRFLNIKNAWNSFLKQTLVKLILISDLVVVKTISSKRYLERIFKVSNVKVVPFGFVANRLPPFLKPRLTVKKVFAFSEFIDDRSIALAIDAVSKIRCSSLEPIELVIAGHNKTKKYNSLSGLRKKFAHIENLQFIQYNNEVELSKVMNESTVVVFPFQMGISTASLLHYAFSHGKAVVVPELEEYYTMIKSTGCRAEMFTNASPCSLGNSLQHVLAHDSYREFLEQANYSAANRCTILEITETYWEYFKLVLQIKQRRRAKGSPLMQGELSI